MGRNREEVVSLILQSAMNGATQTTLMYDTYLSHGAIEEHLSILVREGFLEYRMGEMKYRTTQIGLQKLAQGQHIGNRSCNHQCKKCGVLYLCDDTGCTNPFYHGMCKGCMNMASRGLFECRNQLTEQS